MGLFFSCIDDRILRVFLILEIKIFKKVRKVVRASNWEGIQISDKLNLGINEVEILNA